MGRGEELDLQRLAVVRDEYVRKRRPQRRPRQVTVVERLHVHGDDRRHARGDLAHVVDAHDDETALDELGAAGVDDGDAGPVSLDRRRDLLVPDGVAREVEVVEHESAHRGEHLGHPARAVTGGSPRDSHAVPLEGVLDRPRVEPEVAKRLLVLGLAEDGNVAREELLCTRVQVVAVAVRDDDGVEIADDLLGWERQRDGRVRDLAGGALDRRPRTGVVEHRVDQDPSPREGEDHGRAADECELHGPVFYLTRPDRRSI